MQLTTKAIILSSLKYGDTSLIVKAFTESDGLKSYMLKGVLTSKKGRLKAAYFQPLTQLEMVVDHKNKGTLERIKEVKVSYHYQSLHSEVAKNALTMFLAEMLSNSIHEEECNEDLFLFLETMFQWVDTHDDIANFHLYFLLQLTRYLGFNPDTSDMDALYFDLRDGAFVTTLNLNPLIQGENLVYFKSLLGINFDDLHSIKIKKSVRQELLKLLVLYFELHLQGFRKPRSLEVLNDVFR